MKILERIMAQLDIAVSQGCGCEPVAVTAATLASAMLPSVFSWRGQLARDLMECYAQVLRRVRVRCRMPQRPILWPG